MLWLLLVTAMLPAAPDRPADDQQAAGMEALRSALAEYRDLVAQISPDHLPGQMVGYPEATEELEKLGERLEVLSRQAVGLDREPGDWAPLAARIAEFRDDLVQLRRVSTPLRAYSHCIRAGIKRPRWAVAQVAVGNFIAPEVTSFEGAFTRSVNLEASPGQLLGFQLVAVPIQQDIEHVQVRLADRLRGPGGGIAHPDMACHLAATRSTPLEPDQRELSDCPYRLRPLTQPVRLPADLVQPLCFTLQVPPDAAQGRYTGSLVFTGREVHSLELELRLTISGN